MRTRGILAAILLGACLGAGCGADRVAAPSVLLEPTAEYTKQRFPKAGLTLSLPAALSLEEERPAPGLFRGTYANWYVSGFAYRRREQLPRRKAELTAARRRLVRQIRRRDRRFKLVRARNTKVGGAQAIEIVGDQTISKSRLRTRSVHVYRGQAEYVVELVAPVALFNELQRGVFNRIVESIRVTGKIQKPKPKSKSKR